MSSPEGGADPGAADPGAADPGAADPGAAGRPRSPAAEAAATGSGTAADLDALPPALSSMWRLCRLGYRHEPRLLLAAFLLSLLAALPDALIAVWLALLGRGVLRHDRGLLLAAALGLAASTAATWFLRTISTRVQRRFRDRVTIALEGHVARLQASIPTIAHQERSELLDRLAVLRDQVFVLDHMYMSVFSTCGWLLRLAVTVSLLVSVHPALALLALFALPTVATSGWRPAVERAEEERAAPANRLARHLFVVATTAAPGKEVRLAGLGPRLIEQRRAEWERWYRPVFRARRHSAYWHGLAWAVFGAGYVGAIVFVASVLHAASPSVLLVLAAGSRLSAYVAATVGEIGFLRGVWMDGSRRLAWLEEYAAALAAPADLPAPQRLRHGVTFERVSFAYPGTDRLVLRDVSLHLPASAVVAIVGENGAGKSTLVKLLGKLYQPTSGRILVDGEDLARVQTQQWRERLAGAFQDFFRFELIARHSVGLGDVPRAESEPAVRTAVGRAGAEDVVERLGAGLDTQLGPTWPEGVEVSFGQWQKLALARGFMRDRPLLLLLDEPAAALDAETEHALFERYATALRGGAGNSGPGNSGAGNGGPGDGGTGNGGGAGGALDGRISILVSHRFSTVRMADLIVVLDGARVAEVGSHDELMARDGSYAQLYRIQAEAYR
jgi:ATP-binding cassette, subfamily B, bacterial